MSHRNKSIDLYTKAHTHIQSNNHNKSYLSIKKHTRNSTLQLFVNRTTLFNCLLISNYHWKQQTIEIATNRKQNNWPRERVLFSVELFKYVQKRRIELFRLCWAHSAVVSEFKKWGSINIIKKSIPMCKKLYALYKMSHN